MQISDDVGCADDNEAGFSSISIAETILFCTEGAAASASIGDDLSSIVSEYLIMASRKKMPASEVNKLVDVLISRIP